MASSVSGCRLVMSSLTHGYDSIMVAESVGLASIIINGMPYGQRRVISTGIIRFPFFSFYKKDSKRRITPHGARAAPSKNRWWGTPSSSFTHKTELN